MPEINKITVSKEGARWVARFRWSHETKEVVKQAGFRFDPASKLWWTTEQRIAARLTDPDAAVREAQAANQAIQASRAVSSNVRVPAPDGLYYLPYQLAGIEYALGKPGVLLADAMGLGKTIQAVGVINADATIRRVLVICPASLKVNWARELTKWLVRPMSIGVAGSGVEFPHAADVVIINYDILTKYRSQIDRIKWDLLVADEAHLVKNPKARRTEALFGKNGRNAIRAARRLFMTGTPIVNRPIELWNIVQSLDPNDLGR